MSTTALGQLFPSMNAEELAKKQSLNEELVEYHAIEGTPFTKAYVKEQRKWYLLLGKTKMETNGFESENEMDTWISSNMWSLVMRVASTVCRDMIQPYIQWKAAQEAGIPINKPELVTNKNE